MLIKGIIIYLIVLNLIGLLLMAEDKRRARKKKWRISEKTLFLAALLGGSIGTWSGMYLFHHKTKHWYFQIGMPGILLLQVLAVFMVWRKLL